MGREGASRARGIWRPCPVSQGASRLNIVGNPNPRIRIMSLPVLEPLRAEDLRK